MKLSYLAIASMLMTICAILSLILFDTPDWAIPVVLVVAGANNAILSLRE